MKEKNSLRKIANIAYVNVFVLIIAFSVYMITAEHISVYQSRPFDGCEILDDYSETVKEDSSAPVGIRKVYNLKLSEITPTKDYLAFYIVHHYAEVRIEDQKVYELTVDNDNRVGSSPSSNWVFIPLDNNDSGKAVEIILTPVYKSVISRKPEFMLGARSDIILERLKTDLPQLILAILCIFIGVILMIVQPYYIRHKKSASWEMMYLGNFLFLIGVWRITDTRFSSILFSEHPMPLGYIAIAVLFLSCVPFMLFLGERLKGRRKKIALTVALGCSLVTFAVIICQIFKIAELRETLTVCHMMLILCMVVVIAVSIGHKNKNAIDLGSYPKGQFFRRIWHSPHGLCLFPLFKRISAAFLAFLPLPQSVLLR